MRLGRVFADDLTFVEAIDDIVALARAGRGGYVVTPNVDHVVLAETDPSLLASYEDAALSLVDGAPLLWLSRAMGEPLPEKISGSDLVEPLIARAASEGLVTFFLGAREGVGQKAARILAERHENLVIGGVVAPPLGFEDDPRALRAVLDEVRAARPHLVLVALGCPKQERFMHDVWREVAPSVLLGIGATLDFIAGEVQRAPAALSRLGLEWAYRLAQEPRRMAKRYIGRDWAIGPIALRTLALPKRERTVRVRRLPNA